MGLNQNIKDFNRVVEIIQILTKYRLEEIIFIFQLKKLVPKDKKIRWSKGEASLSKYSLWERIRMAFEELGPAFVKLGQVLSNRKDILPEELVKEFERLQNNVASFPFEQVSDIISSELNEDIDSLFKHFSKKPLASASIGQVHKAILKSGEKVVVKVQRPGIHPIIQRDLSILKRGVRLGQTTLENRYGITNMLEFFEEFENTMNKELRYSHEARNIKQFRTFYKDYKNFYIPDVFRSISTDKVLVMEYRSGCKITDVETLKSWGIQPEKIAEKGMDIYMTQMFEYGYFHADPHPGNILIQQDGTICLIDFGMVGRLMKRDKFAFADVLISIARQDTATMARSLRQLASSDGISNQREFEQDLNEIVEEYATLDVAEMNIAELGIKLQQIIHKYKMKVPGSLFLLLRAMAILEGIGKTVHPTFNTYEYIKPYGRKLLKEKFSRDNILAEVFTRAGQFDYFLRKFPVDLQDILSNISKGKLHVEIDHQGYEPGVEKINKAFNRLMLSLIIVGLLISSSIIIHGFSGDSASGQGTPLISIIGFVLAGILSLVLLWSAFRSSD